MRLTPPPKLFPLRRVSLSTRRSYSEQRSITYGILKHQSWIPTREWIFGHQSRNRQAQLVIVASKGVLSPYLGPPRQPTSHGQVGTCMRRPSDMWRMNISGNCQYCNIWGCIYASFGNVSQIPRQTLTCEKYWKSSWECTQYPNDQSEASLRTLSRRSLSASQQEQASPQEQ